MAKYERWTYQKEQEKEFKEQYKWALDYKAANIGQHLASSWQRRKERWEKATGEEEWEADDIGMEVLQELMNRVEKDKRRAEDKPKDIKKKGPFKDQSEALYKKLMVEKDDKTLHQILYQSLQTTGAAASAAKSQQELSELNANRIGKVNQTKDELEKDREEINKKNRRQRSVSMLKEQQK